MLVELAVYDLGVIAEARIPFSPGLVALTGETGAGKTMVIEALQLLAGGRPDPSRVRSGAAETVVEALFAVGDTEWVLRRVVPASGRSRAYINGALSTAAELSELSTTLIELHGQHAQQALLQPQHQRSALDRAAGVDRAPLVAARSRVVELERRLSELGAQTRARAREIDLLRFQLDEIEEVAPRIDELEALDAEEDLLEGAVQHRAAGEHAAELLTSDGGAVDQVAAAIAAVDGLRPFGDVTERLRSLHAELHDCGIELRHRTEGIEPDEERLGALRARKEQLHSLRRKYGERIEDVIAFADAARSRLRELEDDEADASTIEAELATARDHLVEVGRTIGAMRRAAAAPLAEAIEAALGDLALAGSRVEVEVLDGDDIAAAGEQVSILLAANPGSPIGPLAKVASGGELSRVMLALRLILSGGPPTLVFDEIDAGVGGEAAVAIGRALAGVARDRQVLVVTHLPQIAAFADTQILVTKRVDEDSESTVTTTEVLDDEARVVELARMLSGRPESRSGRAHAKELLDAAAEARVGLGVGPGPLATR